MKITTAADYGIRALVYLASQDRGKVCLVSEISKAQEIPEKYLAKIMQSLVKAGLVKSLRGVKGGFVLARSPEEMTIRDALEGIQGPVSLHKCIDNPDECGFSEDCGVRTVWIAAQESMLEVLSGASLRSVAETSGETLSQ